MKKSGGVAAEPRHRREAGLPEHSGPRRDEARQSTHGEERAVQGRRAFRRPHHPACGGAGIGQRDRQSGVDAPADVLL